MILAVRQSERVAQTFDIPLLYNFVESGKSPLLSIMCAVVPFCFNSRMRLETTLETIINGIGGQPETHMGALYSKGGRAITLLFSTALVGAVSRIVPMMEEGSLITIPRFFADTIVTEYGVANLIDKNHWERAEALIAIAHPDFRGELRRSLKAGLR